jgi:hypothetical protein
MTSSPNDHTTCRRLTKVGPIYLDAATVTPMTAVNLSAVKSAHSGIAAAIQNATGRTSALIAVACVGLITANRMTDVSFSRLLQVLTFCS